MNEDYIDPDMDDVEDAEEDSEWQPAMGTDYWDEDFDVEGWAEDLSRHINYWILRGGGAACPVEVEPRFRLHRASSFMPRKALYMSGT